MIWWAIERKVWRQGRPDPLDQGLELLDGYLAGLELESGWLVIFDRREGVGAIAERASVERVQSSGGRAVTVIRG